MKRRRPTRAEIRGKFEAGAITWQEVFALLARAPKPWESPEWKKRRAEVLKDKCEACGTNEGPLYVQHTWHPFAFAELCDLAKEPLRAGWYWTGLATGVTHVQAIPRASFS